MKKKSKERFDKNRIDNPFKINDIVWWKANAKTKEENRKLKPKYRGPYKITEVIKPEGHGLNVEITHMNNVEDKHIVSVRQLKIAKLRPEQIGDIISNKEMKMEIKMEKNKDEVNQHEIHNLKRRNIYTQARRAGKTKKVKETREEWEVQDIVNERKNKKTGFMEYEIKWER